MKAVAVGAVVGGGGTHLLIAFGPGPVGLLVAFMAAVYVGLDVARIVAQHRQKRGGYR